MATFVSVVLVDDHAPWREGVRSILLEQPELCVVAEISDGLEAVQKAHALQPDVILLDIAFPS